MARETANEDVKLLRPMTPPWEGQTPEEEYARLFQILEDHRVLQVKIAYDRAQYDQIMKSANGLMESIGGDADSMLRMMLARALSSTPRPEVPPELPESARFHELHTQLAKKAAGTSPRGAGERS